MVYRVLLNRVSVVWLVGVLLASPVGAVSVHNCANDHDPEMIPVQHRPALWEALLNNGEAISAESVQIDGLGADPNTPWTVHAEGLNVYSLPNSDYSTTLTTLAVDERVSGDYYLVKQTDEEWLRLSRDGNDAWVSVTGLNRVHPLNVEQLKQAPNLEIGKEIVNRWWGIPLDYEPNDLVSVPASYTGNRGGKDYQLREQAALAVVEMIDAARADGVNFLVSSPYRSGRLQQSIYLRNIKRSGKNQRYSAPPGHSEHQLGLTIDFSTPDTNRFLSNDDPQHAWLEKNGTRFGFRQTYTATNISETGYVEEPWHWRYVGIEPKQTAWFLNE